MQEAALRLVLECREAELREAMKLPPALTTLLHMLRINMEPVSKAKSYFVEQRFFLNGQLNFCNISKTPSGGVDDDVQTEGFVTM